MAHLGTELACLLFRLQPAVRRTVGEGRYHETMASFRKNFREIDARTDRETGVLAFHRIFLMTGLALYRALEDDDRDQRELIDTVHDLMWNGPLKKMVSMLAFFIGKSDDPFERFLQILGPKNEWFFPCPPWEKVPVEVSNGVGWHQKRCPMHEFFKKEGVGELTRAYGEMDLRIAGALPEYIELKRGRALCTGDGHCDFLYHRKSQVDSGAVA